jgi:hypothetical protein
MKSIFIVFIAIVSIALYSCSKTNKHKSVPMAQLAQDDSSLVKENAEFGPRIDSLIMPVARYNADTAYTKVTNVTFFKMKVVKEQIYTLLSYLRSCQLDLFMVTDDVKRPVATELGFEDLKNPSADFGPTDYFYGNRENGYKGIAHKLREKIGLYKAALLLSLDTLKLIPTDTMGLSMLDTAHDASGKLMSWEAYNFDGTNAAEDYVLLERLRNAVLNSGYEALRLLFDEFITERDNATPIVIGDGC